MFNPFKSLPVTTFMYYIFKFIHTLFIEPVINFPKTYLPIVLLITSIIVTYLISNQIINITLAPALWIFNYIKTKIIKTFKKFIKLRFTKKVYKNITIILLIALLILFITHYKFTIIEILKNTYITLISSIYELIIHAANFIIIKLNPDTLDIPSAAPKIPSVPLNLPSPPTILPKIPTITTSPSIPVYLKLYNYLYQIYNKIHPWFTLSSNKKLALNNWYDWSVWTLQWINILSQYLYNYSSQIITYPPFTILTIFILFIFFKSRYFECFKYIIKTLFQIIYTIITTLITCKLCKKSKSSNKNATNSNDLSVNLNINNILPERPLTPKVRFRQGRKLFNNFRRSSSAPPPKYNNNPINSKSNSAQTTHIPTQHSTPTNSYLFNSKNNESINKNILNQSQNITIPEKMLIDNILDQKIKNNPFNCILSHPKHPRNGKPNSIKIARQVYYFITKLYQHIQQHFPNDNTIKLINSLKKNNITDDGLYQHFQKFSNINYKQFIHELLNYYNIQFPYKTALFNLQNWYLSKSKMQDSITDLELYLKDINTALKLATKYSPDPEQQNTLNEQIIITTYKELFKQITETLKHKKLSHIISTNYDEKIKKYKDSGEEMKYWQTIIARLINELKEYTFKKTDPGEIINELKKEKNIQHTVNILQTKQAQKYYPRHNQYQNRSRLYRRTNNPRRRRRINWRPRRSNRSNNYPNNHPNNYPTNNNNYPNNYPTNNNPNNRPTRNNPNNNPNNRSTYNNPNNNPNNRPIINNPNNRPTNNNNQQISNPKYNYYPNGNEIKCRYGKNCKNINCNYSHLCKHGEKCSFKKRCKYNHTSRLNIKQQRYKQQIPKDSQQLNVLQNGIHSTQFQQQINPNKLEKGATTLDFEQQFQNDYDNYNQQQKNKNNNN